ncbi:hypothetical protein AB7952_08160 [Streptomyces sp. PG2]
MKGGKATGIDPDIAEALGKQLGVKFEFQNGKFDQACRGSAGRPHPGDHVGDERHEGPPERHRLRQRQEGRRRRRLRRLLHRRHLDPRPEGQPQGDQVPGRPVRQGRRPAARHHLRGRGQGAEQEVHEGRRQGDSSC